MRLKIFIFAGICLIFFQSFAQEKAGLLPIVNFSQLDYHWAAQNWSVIQDQRGLLYFGNNNGVLEFDGVEWKRIETGNNAVKSIAIDKSGKIYAGLSDDFGYITFDSLSNTSYKSLKDSFSEQLPQFGDIWNVHVFSDGRICFQSYKYIFLWDGKKISQISSDQKMTKSFYIKDNLFISVKNDGLFLLVDESLVRVENIEAFSEGIVSMILLNENHILFATKSNNLYTGILGNKGMISDCERLNTGFDELLSDLRITDLYRLNNGLISIATKKNGLFVIDKYGNDLMVIDKEHGLQDNLVKDQYQDAQGNLWVTFGNGISRIEINSPITQFNEKYKLEGTIEAIERFNNKLLVATTMGVYVVGSNAKKEVQFNLIKGLEQAAFYFLKLQIHDEQLLLISMYDGVYQLDTNFNVSNILKCYPWEMLQSDRNPERVFIGLDGNGAVYIERKNDEWSTPVAIEGIEGYVRYLEKGNNDDVWFAQANHGIERIKDNDDLDAGKVTLDKYNNAQGLPDNPTLPIIYSGDIIFGSKTGIFRFEGSSGKFIPDNAFNHSFDNPERTFVFRLHSDSKGKLWIVAIIEDEEKGDEFVLGYFKKQENNYELVTSAFEGIKKETKHCIYSEKNGLVWIGGTDGLYRYVEGSDAHQNNVYNTYIRKVLANRDSIVFHGNFVNDSAQLVSEQNANKIPLFDFNYNTIRFYYAAQSIGNSMFNMYSSILEGYDDQWSEWNNETYKNYTNLPEGTYTFKVKSRNLYNVVGTQAEFTIKILPPWYRTILAYALYILGFALALFVIIRLNARRLRAVNLRLENIIKERTQEIQEKNKELEKLSIVASETDNSVVIADADFNIEWVNDGFTRMLGYSLDEYINIFGVNMNNASTNPDMQNILNKCLDEKKSIIYTTKNLHKDGTEIWVQTNLTPIIHEGIITRLIAIDSDVTRIKEAEEEIRHQKEEITDSIFYARRIQTAILPNLENADTIMGEHFIMFKPKDIVSGDFYWATNVNDWVIVTAADCTGHGVPGAFMSMLGVSFLNDIVRKKELLQPEIILNELRDAIIDALSQKGDRTSQKDGMDMSLIVLNRSSDECYFAGANNPLWIIRSNAIEGLAPEDDTSKLVEEVKPDKMPVAIYPVMDSFSRHKVDISKGDQLYLFTDGYPDQFGGPKGKKLKYKPFKRLLVENCNKSMAEQKEALEISLDSWVNYNPEGSGTSGAKYDQIDDITIIGLKI